MTTVGLFLTGTVGVGKTTAAQAVGDLLVAAGVPHAVIDVDWLRRAWPPPGEDPFDVEMAMRNLRAVAANYRDRGAVRLVVAGVLESRQERTLAAVALAAPMTVCRLTADPAVVRERLAQRHGPESRGLAWHLHRAGELDQVLDGAAVEDLRLDVTALTPAQAAEQLVAAVGWRAAG